MRKTQVTDKKTCQTSFEYLKMQENCEQQSQDVRLCFVFNKTTLNKIKTYIVPLKCAGLLQKQINRQGSKLKQQKLTLKLKNAESYISHDATQQHISLECHYLCSTNNFTQMFLQAEFMKSKVDIMCTIKKQI